MTTSINWGTVFPDYVIKINNGVYIGQQWFLDTLVITETCAKAAMRIVRRREAGGTVQCVMVKKLRT